MDHFQSIDGELYAEDVPLARIAAEVGTPVYVYSRATLERLVGLAEDWSCLDEYLLQYTVDPAQRATVFASSFAAALELVREGDMELNQKQAFAPLYFRKRPASAAAAPDLSVE